MGAVSSRTAKVFEEGLLLLTISITLLSLLFLRFLSNLWIIYECFCYKPRKCPPCMLNVDFMGKVGFSKVFGFYLGFFLDTGFLFVSSKGLELSICISFFKVILLQACGANRAFRIQNLLVNISCHPTENIYFWSFLMIYLIIFSYLIDCFSAFNLVFKILRRIQILNFLPLTSHWEEVQQDGEKSKSFFKQKWWKERFSSGEWSVVGESWKYLPQWSINRILFLLLKKTRFFYTKITLCHLLSECVVWKD